MQNFWKFSTRHRRNFHESNFSDLAWKIFEDEEKKEKKKYYEKTSTSPKEHLNRSFKVKFMGDMERYDIRPFLTKGLLWPQNVLCNNQSSSICKYVFFHFLANFQVKYFHPTLEMADAPLSEHHFLK